MMTFKWRDNTHIRKLSKQWRMSFLRNCPIPVPSPPEQTKHSTLKTSPTTTLCSGNPGLYHTFYISIWAAWCTSKNIVHCAMFFVNALSKLPRRCPEIWVRSVPRLNRARTDKIGGGKKNDCCVWIVPSFRMDHNHKNDCKPLPHHSPVLCVRDS